MKEAWSWATTEEKRSIRLKVQEEQEMPLGAACYRWWFQLVPKDPTARKHSPDQKVLICCRGITPPNRGMTFEDIQSLVATQRPTKRKQVKFLPAKKERVRKRVAI